MKDKQTQFEKTVLLEAELTKQGASMETSIDNLTTQYMTLSEFQSEFGRDLDLQTRQHLATFINQRFSKLNTIQQQIADLRYRKNMTYREISDQVNRSISTINHHMKQIDHILRSM